MKNERRQRNHSFLLALLLGCWATAAAHAQFFPGGGGGQGTSTRTYQNATDVGDAVIQIDPTTRQIIVIADEDTQGRIKDVISSLDKPRPQVLIKVVFLEVTYNNSSDIGVEGGFRKSLIGAGTNATSASVANTFGLSQLGSALSATTNLNALGQSVQNFPPTPPGGGLYQILGRDYEVALRAIAQAGKAEVLSRPSILARNSQPATINLGQSVPLVTATRFDAVNGQINTVTYTPVGIILSVTPFITPDGMVEMIVQPQISKLADRSLWVPISAGALAPVIDTRTADTVVVVPDGQTVIIGGLMQQEKSQADSKIPILGDIPLLGNLFKHRQKANAKTELMIFLTPHVIPAPTQLAGLTAAERENSTMPSKSLSEQELDRFLNGLPIKPEEARPESSKPAKKRK